MLLCGFLLTVKAHGVVHKLLSLRCLLVVIEKDILLPPLVLPDLTDLTITYNHSGNWLQVFHGAKLERLVAVTFNFGSEQTIYFLEQFEDVVYTPSARNELLRFCFYTSLPWTPNYSSLLQFTQLTDLVIKFSCAGVCSSTVDNRIVTSLKPCQSWKSFN